MVPVSDAAYDSATPAGREGSEREFQRAARPTRPKSLRVEWTATRQVIEGTFGFENLVFPEPGEYRLKLFVAGEFLMERALHLTLPGTTK
jgi:hypothetical protein